MTYKELLNLYKKGELSSEQKKQIMADIEKQEAISEFLFETDDIPELTDASLEAEISKDNKGFDEKRFQRMIKKSIRKAFIKFGVAVCLIVLAVVIAANATLPYMVDAMYYNPAEVVGTASGGRETNRISLDTMVYTELFTPGYYRTSVAAIAEGYGEYDIEIGQNITVSGQFKNVYGNIDKGRLTLFDDSLLRLPAQNSFMTDESSELTGFHGMGRAGSREDALRKLNKLDESDFYVAYVTFNKVMTYDEFVDWSDESGVTPDWAAVCQTTQGGVYDFAADCIVGFNYLGNAADIAYDNEKYPYLSFFDVVASAKKSGDNNYPKDVMETHMVSMLEYMLERKEYRDMVGCNVTDSQLIQLAEDIEENGLSIYGFAITAQKDKLLEISKDENLSYICTTSLA